MKTLHVRPVSARIVNQKWGTNLPRLLNPLYVRCNAKGQINWDTTLVYGSAELARREKGSVIFKEAVCE